MKFGYARSAQKGPIMDTPSSREMAICDGTAKIRELPPIWRI